MFNPIPFRRPWRIVRYTDYDPNSSAVLAIPPSTPGSETHCQDRTRFLTYFFESHPVSSKRELASFQGLCSVLCCSKNSVLSLHTLPWETVRRPEKVARQGPPSEEEPGSILFVVFIPSKTKDGDDLPQGEDQQQWAEAVGDLLAQVYGGATEVPVAKGKWLNDDGKIITEEVILIHSYVRPSQMDDDGKLRQVARILHRMGKRTKQGEIGVVIDGVFHRIRRFPLADAEQSR